MLENGLIVGGINPIHYGHIALIKIGLKEVEHLDFRVGRKSKYILPYELRVKTLRKVLFYEGLENKVNIIEVPSKSKICNFDTSKYQALVLGSDVLNNFSPNCKKHRAQDKDFFSRFKILIVLERKGFSLDKEVMENIKLKSQLIYYPPVSNISSKEIRRRYRDGVTLDGFMPMQIFDIISPYAKLFLTTDF